MLTAGPDPTVAVLHQAAPVRIVATTADGQQLWSRTFSEGVLKHVAADNHGDLLVVLGSTNSPSWRPERIRRFDGATGRVTWQYHSYDGMLSEVAVHPDDGRVFVTDELYHWADTAYGHRERRTR